jgi:chromosome segregation ATPase
MKALKTTFIATAACTVATLTLVSPHRAFSETPGRHNAKALLDESKLIDYEQRIAAKKTEMDRLNEDLKKGADEIDMLEKRIQKVGGAADEATKQLEQLTSLKKRATAELELLNLRIEAERLKGDGLRMLQNANRKLQEAAAKRNDETTARTALVAAETRQLATKAPAVAADSGPAKPHVAKNEPTLTEWRKNLEKAERATATAESQAREAMAAAGARLQEAEAAAAKAEKKQEELALEKDPAFPGGNDPLSPAAKTADKK